jgi:hypothetical protein
MLTTSNKIIIAFVLFGLIFYLFLNTTESFEANDPSELMYGDISQSLPSVMSTDSNSTPISTAMSNLSINPSDLLPHDSHGAQQLIQNSNYLDSTGIIGNSTTPKKIPYNDLRPLPIIQKSELDFYNSDYQPDFVRNNFFRCK